MDWLQVVILSVIQGITEFLPISSSGHLVVAQIILGFTKPPVVLDVMLHVGTLLAVLFYFRQELVNLLFGLFKKEKKSSLVLFLVVIATIPAIVVGGLFESQINQTFGSLKINGWFFLLTALLIFSTKWVRLGKKEFPAKGWSASGGNQLNWKDALIIGLFQALAILPAVSRSGATIAAGLWRGASRETAFRFSFYLFIPAIVGALVLQIPDLLKDSGHTLEQYLVGLVIAGVIGYFSLKLLEATLKSDKFYLFGFYCLIIGMIILLV